MLVFLLVNDRFAIACPVDGFSINPKYSTRFIKSMGIYGTYEKLLMLVIHAEPGNPAPRTRHHRLWKKPDENIRYLEISQVQLESFYRFRSSFFALA
jgi:hypothetical protein